MDPIDARKELWDAALFLDHGIRPWEMDYLRPGEYHAIRREMARRQRLGLTKQVIDGAFA